MNVSDAETDLTENHKSQPHGGTRERERWITKDDLWSMFVKKMSVIFPRISEKQPDVGVTRSVSGSSRFYLPSLFSTLSQPV